MDKSYALECVRSFAERVKQTMRVRQIILFGSYATGAPTEDSDIDVAVITEDAPGDWLEVASRLFRLRRDINLSIEPVLLDASSDRSDFLEEIRRTGELIYDSRAA
jgi:uncharacterized protein